MYFPGVVRSVVRLVCHKLMEIGNCKEKLTSDDSDDSSGCIISVISSVNIENHMVLV